MLLLLRSSSWTKGNRGLLEKLVVSQMVNKFPPLFMEFKSSLPRAKELHTESRPQPADHLNARDPSEL
jgi:hypothetical protein